MAGEVIFRSRVQVQEISHPSSVIDPVIDAVIFSGGRWQLRVAGGGPDPFSPLFSPYPRQLGQHAVLTLPQDSVLK